MIALLVKMWISPCQWGRKSTIGLGRKEYTVAMIKIPVVFNRSNEAELILNDNALFIILDIWLMDSW